MLENCIEALFTIIGLNITQTNINVGLLGCDAMWTSS